MPNYALRKSAGPFSSGTRVNVISDNTDGTLTVEVCLPENENVSRYMLDETVFDIEAEDVVKLRDRTDVIHSRSRNERRNFLNELFGTSKEV